MLKQKKIKQKNKLKINLHFFLIIMGHLVNPISLRLGRTQSWRSQWYRSTNKNYISLIKEDFLLYNYIDSFFIFNKLLKKREKQKENALIKIKLNNISNFKIKIRNKNKNTSQSKNYNQKKDNNINNNNKYKSKSHLRPSKRKRVKIKRYSKTELVEKLSLIFSHSNILRVNCDLIINMHIYDGAFETLKSKQNFSSIFYSFNKFKSKSKFNSNYNYKSKFNFNKFIKHNKKNFYRNRNKNFNYLTDYNKIITKSLLIYKNKGYSNLFDKFDLQRKKILKKKRQNNNKFLEFLVKKQNIVNNTEMLFINSRIRYLCSYLNIIFFKPLPANKKIKNFLLKKYLKLIKLLVFFNRKQIYKNKLQSIFILRLLTYSLLKIRLLISSILQMILRKKINKKNNNNNNNTTKKTIFVRQLLKRRYDKKSKLKKKNNFSMQYNFNLKFLKSNKKKILKKFYNKLRIFKSNYIKLNRFLLYIMCVTAQHTIENNKLKLYLNRFKIWFFVSRILFENIKTIILKSQNNKYNNIQLNYFGLTNKTQTANMLATYITKKLYQKYTIFETIKPLTIDLSKNFAIAGFKISCAGRLTKKQRASLFVQQDKRVPANTIDCFIDYATSIVRLRHGVCGLKIWITRKKTYKNFEYNFKYNYKF